MIFEKFQFLKKIFFEFRHETWWAYSRDKNKIFYARNFFKNHFSLSYVHLYVHWPNSWASMDQQHVFDHNFLHFGARTVILWYYWSWGVAGSNEHKIKRFGSAVFELQFINGRANFSLEVTRKKSPSIFDEIGWKLEYMLFMDR